MTDFNYTYICAAKAINDLHSMATDTCQLIGAGYTSNLDKDIKNPLITINNLLKKYSTHIPDNEPGTILSNPIEFLEAILYYASRGLGAEFSITPALSRFLASEFICEDAVGGTAAQSAMAIGSFGYPVILHQTDCSEELLQHLQQANLYLVVNGKLVHCKNCSGATQAMLHYIVQLQKGSRLYVNEQDILIPESNRLIFNFDTINPILSLNSSYLNFIEKNARLFCSYIISGFNVIIEESILEQIIGRITEHLKYVKLANRDIVLYFEDAFYLKINKKVEIYSRLIPCVDIFSLNEEELIQLTRLSGFALDDSSTISIIRSIEHLISVYKPQMGVVLHTKHYSMYIGKKINADIRKGLAAGNLIAAVKALTGRYGNIQSIKECMNTPLSPYGLLFSKEIQHIPSDYQIDIVPTKYIEAPQFTVGLGDSFIGGIQTCFLKY